MDSPPGTLRDQLLYPTMVNNDGGVEASQSIASAAAEWSDEELLAVLDQVNLPELASRSADGDPIRGLSAKLE